MWFFILEKILSGFLFWKNYQVVFYFGKKIMWFFHLEPTNSQSFGSTEKSPNV
jgi:hypothetical protein